MNKQEFDNYKFSIKTEIKYEGEWHKITEVLFDDREFWFDGSGRYISYKEIEDIRETL